MRKSKELSQEIKNLIIRAVEKKFPSMKISELYHVAKSTISVLIERYRDRKTLENKHRSGRSKITTEHQNKILVRQSKKDPLKIAVELNGILSKNYGVKCSVDTTKRRLRQLNLFGRRPAKNH